MNAVANPSNNGTLLNNTYDIVPLVSMIELIHSRNTDVKVKVIDSNILYIHERKLPKNFGSFC